MKDKSLKTASGRTFLAAYAIAFLLMVSTALAQSPGTVFRVPLLLPGSYTLTVSAGGFATGISRSIQVTVSQTSSVNVTLAIAGTNPTVQVNSISLD
jgi:hypothetical protein